MDLNRHLRVVRNATPVTSPTRIPLEPHQLELIDGNHPAVQYRQRAVAAAVIDDPRFQARHQIVMWWLCAAADKDGKVNPKDMTAHRLARELGRDYSGVCRDIRDLEAAGLLTRTPIAGSRGPRYVYWIPGMTAPVK